MLSARRHLSRWMPSGDSSSVSSQPRRSPRPRHVLAGVDVLKPGDVAFPFVAAQAAAGDEARALRDVIPEIGEANPRATITRRFLRGWTVSKSPDNP